MEKKYLGRSKWYQSWCAKLSAKVEMKQSDTPHKDMVGATSWICES